MDNSNIENNNRQKKLNLISARDLQQANLPKLNTLVEDILYEGLAILAGPPKSGKSWLALQLACAVVKGKTFLGKETVKSECLYLALEDSHNRLQNRLNTILNGELILDGLYVDINCNRLDSGLMEQLENTLKEKTNIKLIIIDTLQLVRGTLNKNDTLYGNDYKDLSKFKGFADKYHITILLIHHFRKMNDISDAFNRFSGSTGIIGVADTMLAFYKEKRTSNEAILAVSGRDVEDEQLVLIPNANTHEWDIKGTIEDIRKEREKELYYANPIFITIRKLLEDSLNNTVCIKSSDLLKKIIEITGTIPKEKTPASLTKSINKMEYELLMYDNIYYKAPSKNGGASGRNMYFCRSNRQKNIS